MNQDNFSCMGIHLNEQQSGVDLPIVGRVKPGPEVVMGVFDGMGGEECGEVASWIAADCARDFVMVGNPCDDLLCFCEEANARICEYADAHGVSVMGTTAAILAFTQDQITLCNIGDSRIYRFSQGQLEQISVDHVGMAPYGRKAPLSQNLGIPPEELKIEPYVAVGEYHADDIYLICSDGLTDMVSVDVILHILKEEPFGKAADLLMRTALENGGRDNITLILCKVEKGGNALLQFIRRNFHRERENHS